MKINCCLLLLLFAFQLEAVRKKSAGYELLPQQEELADEQIRGLTQAQIDQMSDEQIAEINRRITADKTRILCDVTERLDARSAYLEKKHYEYLERNQQGHR